MEEKKEIKNIIATSHADVGLCNKLKCIINAMRMAEKFNSKCYIHWPMTWQCGAEFHDLFEKDMNIEVIDEKKLAIIKKEGADSCESYNDILNAKNDWVLLNNWRFILFPNEVPEHFAKVFPDNIDGRNIDLEFDRIPKEIKVDILKYFNKLHPTKSILDKVNKILKENDNFKEVIGLHVRRTEALLTSDRRGWVSTDEKFFEAIDVYLKENPNFKFFLATDGKETEANFISKYGDKIIVLPNKNWAKETKESTEHALIDLLLLSKSKRLLGSYFSTFNEVAWWLSGCKQLVIILGDEEAKKKVLEIQQTVKNRNIIDKGLRETVRILRRKSKIVRWAVNKVTALKGKKNG